MQQKNSRDHMLLDRHASRVTNHNLDQLALIQKTRIFAAEIGWPLKLCRHHLVSGFTRLVWAANLKFQILLIKISNMFSSSPSHFQSIGTGFSSVPRLNRFLEQFKYQFWNKLLSTTRSWHKFHWFWTFFLHVPPTSRDFIGMDSNQFLSKDMMSFNDFDLVWSRSEISDMVKIRENQYRQHFVRSWFLLASSVKCKCLYDLRRLAFVSVCSMDKSIFRKTLNENPLTLEENDRYITYAWIAQYASFLIFDLFYL